MRNKIIFNNNWFFSKETSYLLNVDKNVFEDICLPHIWNALDGQDGVGDSYRGTSCYKKFFEIK